MFPRSPPISDSEVNTLFACTVGRKSTSRREQSAFPCHWRNFEKCSGWSRLKIELEYHPRSAIASLGEPASEGAGYCNRGDHQENGHKHSNRVAGAIKTSARYDGDFCHHGASGAEQVKVPVKTSTIEHKERLPILKIFARL